MTSLVEFRLLLKFLSAYFSVKVSLSLSCDINIPIVVFLGDCVIVLVSVLRWRMCCVFAFLIIKIIRYIYIAPNPTN